MQGLEAAFWSNSGPVRQISERRLPEPGFPISTRTPFRDTLVQLWERMRPTIEHFKAWSQNLGHEHVQTTLTSYGSIAPHRQGELVRSVVLDADLILGIDTDREALEQFKRLMHALRRAA